MPDLANQIASCWLLFRHALAPAGAAAAAFYKKRILRCSQGGESQLFLLMLNFEKMGIFQKNMKYYSVTIFSVCCQKIAKISKIMCFKNFRHIWNLIYSFVAFFFKLVFFPLSFLTELPNLEKEKI